jgi:hypothetical protein
MTSPNPKPRAGEHTPEIDALIDGMLHRNGIPQCDEWDVLAGCARTLEIERDLLIAQQKELVEALGLMLKAWEQLMPNLKHGVVQNYELVCTTAPAKARAVLAKVRPNA